MKIELRERSPEARDAYFRGYRAGFGKAIEKAMDEASDTLCDCDSDPHDDSCHAVPALDAIAALREKMEAKK